MRVTCNGLTSNIHLIPKWRIVVTWPSMPHFCADLPRSSRATAILELGVQVRIFVYLSVAVLI